MGQKDGDTMKMVKCIRNNHSGIPPKLSVGSVYQVEKETDERYFLVGNHNAGSGWNKDRFEVITSDDTIVIDTTAAPAAENKPTSLPDATSTPEELPFDFDAYNYGIPTKQARKQP
jgi:hypothetical protein